VPRWWLALVVCALAGCGTTRWSDTWRTATEQLLISDAVERAVSEIDFSALAGESVFVDTRYMVGTVDERYLISTLRQHLLASGCIIKEKVEDSRYVLEVRTGAVGTNRSDVLLGLPATNLPSGGGYFPAAASIPEIPLVKRTNQQGVCKVAVFAYDRTSGRPVWQSGNRQIVSRAKDVWVFGAGPFQRGEIYQGTKFAGERLNVPLAKDGQKPPSVDDVWVTHELRFPTPPVDSPALVEQAAPANAAVADARAAEKKPEKPPASGPTNATAPSPPMIPVPGQNGPPASLAPQPGMLPPMPSGAVQSPASNPAGAAAGAADVYDWARSVWHGEQAPPP
jgi:hypothetical protein